MSSKKIPVGYKMGEQDPHDLGDRLVTMNRSWSQGVVDENQMVQMQERLKNLFSSVLTPYNFINVILQIGWMLEQDDSAKRSFWEICLQNDPNFETWLRRNFRPTTIPEWLKPPHHISDIES